MTIIMIVIAGSTANLSRLSVYERHDGMVRNSPALYTMIINDVSESLFTHERVRISGVYQYQESFSTRLFGVCGPEPLVLGKQSVRLNSSNHSGQVAQLVERSPEKAGVGGSIPSLATIFSAT